jgi:hypothetical protein
MSINTLHKADDDDDNNNNNNNVQSHTIMVFLSSNNLGVLAASLSINYWRLLLLFSMRKKSSFLTFNQVIMFFTDL